MRAGLACLQLLFKGLFKGGVIVTVSDMSWQCVPRLCSSDGYHHLAKFSPAPLYITVSSTQCSGVYSGMFFNITFMSRHTRFMIHSQQNTQNAFQKLN